MPRQDHHKEKKPFYLEKFKILILVLMLVIALPGYFLLIRPEYSVYRTSKQLAEQYGQQLNIDIKQLKSLKQTISSYQAVSNLDEAKIKEVLPDGIDEANLYVNLESLVKAADLTLDSLSLTPVAKAQKKVVLPQQQGEQPATAPKIPDQVELLDIQLNLSDISYAKLKNFLNLVETNLRLLDATSLSFNASEGSLTISLQAYYLNP